MNEMTDTALDQLIADTLQRKALLADLDRVIIADVRRRARRAWLRRWARAAAFSFGLPLVLLLFVACAYIYIKVYGTAPLTLTILLWPTLGLLFAAGRALQNFSPSEV